MRSSGHFMLIVHVRAKRFLGCFTDRQRCIRKPWRAENVGLADTIGAAFGPGARRKGRRQPGPGPLLALWGAKGTVGQLYEVLETWREKAEHVEWRAFPCGHTLQEEFPKETAEELSAFFSRGRLNPS
jgi:pimeloyl-ACP methyl ester carboxylesterase